MARAFEGMGRSCGIVSVALAGAVFMGSGCQGPQPFFRGPAVIECKISRPECDAEVLTETSALECSDWDLSATGTSNPLVATTCYDSTKDGSMMDKCNKDFCNLTQSRDGFNDTADNQTCKIVGASQKSFSEPGICGGSGGGNVLVSFGTRYRSCLLNDVNNFTCDELDVKTTSNTICMSTATNSIVSQIVVYPSGSQDLGPPSAQDGTFNIFNVLNDNCTITPTSDLAYAVSPGVAATASGAGVTAPITATGGSIAVQQDCSDDVFGCIPKSIDSLRMNVADMTVAGTQLSNVTISSAGPAAVTTTFHQGGPQTFSVAPGALSLVLDGNLAGVRSTFSFQSSSALSLTANSAGFSLTGPLTVASVDANGQPLPVTISTTLSGTPATAQQAACANQSAIQRLFGFEDVSSWTSSQATLSSVTSPVTQGCGALGISGQGYMTINGQSFVSAGLTLAPALSVDLFIPNNQPNQFYVGALQMYLTCPSANVFNAYIGQDELTGLPQNAYSTLRYPLPSNVTSTLQQAPPDCSFSFALNVNQTGKTWILDNLRFTQ